MVRTARFDFSGWFEKQFEPFEGGFVLYTSIRKGGKFVSAEEYEALKTNYVKHLFICAIGVPATIAVGLITLVILSAHLELPGGSAKYTLYGVLAVWAIAEVWAGNAPRRLVKNRGFVTPPRDWEQERRAASAKLEWPMVAIMCGGSAMLLTFNLMRPDKGFVSWLWVFTGGAVLVVFIRVGYAKLRDR